MGFFRKALDFVKNIGSKAVAAGRWIGTKGADFVQRLAPVLPGPFGAAALAGATAMRGIGAIANGVGSMGEHAAGIHQSLSSAASGIRQAYANGGGQVASKIER
jgi:hypothetical protein